VKWKNFAYTVNFFKSSTWGAAWCHCDRYYPKFVRFGGNPSGLVATGQVTMGTAIPIIMGQNIGTCVTALISIGGNNKNARRAAMVHLYFNLIGTVVFLTLFTVLDSFV